jgi:hypothetical protein
MLKIIKTIFYLVIVFFAVRGTADAWTLTVPHDLIYFTTQSNFFIALIYIWMIAATVFGISKPSATLKTASLLYILITCLVANFILDLSAFQEAPVIFGLNTLDMVHLVTPVLVFADFIIFVEHKVLKIKYAALWLLYPVIYFIFILIINAINPKIGYPYPFIDLNLLTTCQLALNVVIYSIAFYVFGLAIVGLDKILPKKIC